MSVFSPRDFCFHCKLDGILYRSLVVSNNSQTSLFNNKVCLTATITTSIRFVHGNNIYEGKKCAEIVPPRDGTTRVQSFSVDEYFCVSVMTVFGGEYEKCFYLQRWWWWWWWCRYRDGIYKQTSMCSLHSIEFLYNAPSIRVPVHTYSIYRYIQHTRRSETFVDSSFLVSPRLAIVFH